MVYITMANYNLDLKKLLCPMPVIKTQKEIKKLQPGDILTITVTDPGALHDIPAWCRIYGHEILTTENLNNEIQIQIKVGSRHGK